MESSPQVRGLSVLTRAKPGANIKSSSLVVQTVRSPCVCAPVYSFPSPRKLVAPPTPSPRKCRPGFVFHSPEKVLAQARPKTRSSLEMERPQTAAAQLECDVFLRSTTYAESQIQTTNDILKQNTNTTFTYTHPSLEQPATLAILEMADMDAIPRVELIPARSYPIPPAPPPKRESSSPKASRISNRPLWGLVTDTRMLETAFENFKNVAKEAKARTKSFQNLKQAPGRTILSARPTLRAGVNRPDVDGLGLSKVRINSHVYDPVSLSTRDSQALRKVAMQKLQHVRQFARLSTQIRNEQYVLQEVGFGDDRHSRSFDDRSVTSRLAGQPSVESLQNLDEGARSGFMPTTSAASGMPTRPRPHSAKAPSSVMATSRPTPSSARSRETATPGSRSSTPRNQWPRHTSPTGTSVEKKAASNRRPVSARARLMTFSNFPSHSLASGLSEQGADHIAEPVKPGSAPSVSIPASSKGLDLTVVGSRQYWNTSLSESTEVHGKARPRTQREARANLTSAGRPKVGRGGGGLRTSRLHPHTPGALGLRGVQTTIAVPFVPLETRTGVPD